MADLFADYLTYIEAVAEALGVWMEKNERVLGPVKRVTKKGGG